MWTKIPGFENYDINECGQIRGWFHEEPFILKTKLDRYGYEQVQLTKDKKRYWVTVHRLVAITFVPNPNNLETVNHIDHNTTNNHYKNLEWLSRGDNTRDARGTRVVRVDTGEVFKSIALAAESINVHKVTLARAIKNNRLCKGVRFERYDE